MTLLLTAKRGENKKNSLKHGKEYVKYSKRTQFKAIKIT